MPRRSGRRVELAVAAPDLDFSTLLDYLSSPAWEQRRDAAEELGDFGAPEAIPYLIRGLSDSVGVVQRAAVIALGRIGTEAVVPALLACLDNPNFRSPREALEALGNLRTGQAVPYFIRFLRDEDERTRAIASSALIVTTRKSMGFRPGASEEKREAAVRKWERWWAANGDTFEPDRPRRGPRRHR